MWPMMGLLLSPFVIVNAISQASYGSGQRSVLHRGQWIRNTTSYSTFTTKKHNTPYTFMVVSWMRLLTPQNYRNNHIKMQILTRLHVSRLSPSHNGSLWRFLIRADHCLLQHCIIFMFWFWVPPSVHRYNVSAFAAIATSSQVIDTMYQALWNSIVFKWTDNNASQVVEKSQWHPNEVTIFSSMSGDGSWVGGWEWPSMALRGPGTQGSVCSPHLSGSFAGGMWDISSMKHFWQVQLCPARLTLQYQPLLKVEQHNMQIDLVLQRGDDRRRLISAEHFLIWESSIQPLQ